MIWIDATCGRAIAASAWSTVSTLRPYAAMAPSSTSVSRASYVASSVDHGRRRAVQLDQVQALDAEVAAGPVGPLPEVVEHVVLRHLLHAPAHLGGDDDPLVRVRGEEAADVLLAAPVAVHVGGVEERHALLGRGLEDLAGRVLGDVAPVRTELPRPESDHGHLSSGPAQLALLH